MYLIRFVVVTSCTKKKVYDDTVQIKKLRLSCVVFIVNFRFQSTSIGKKLPRLKGMGIVAMRNGHGKWGRFGLFYTVISLNLS